MQSNWASARIHLSVERRLERRVEAFDRFHRHVTGVLTPEAEAMAFQVAVLVEQQDVDGLECRHLATL